MFEKVKLGLALGAGGARGFAHIGILKGLEKAGIKISFLAGSSIGALVAACYAINRNTAQLEAHFLDFLASPEFKETGLSLVQEAYQGSGEAWPQRLEVWLKRAYLQARFLAASTILDSRFFMRMIDILLPEVNIEDLPMPFWALGTDLKTGRAVVFKSGPLRSAIYASVAIPGLVRPLEYDNLLVVDGGVLNMVPVLPVRHMGADVVLAVDVEKKIEPEEELSSPVDYLFRVEDVQNYFLKENQLRYADLVIQPDVGHIHWSDFKRGVEMIRLGTDEANRRMEQMKELASRRKYPWRRRPFTCGLPDRDWIEV